MSGDLVIVRAYRGEPLVRRVWEVMTNAVYVCSEERFQRLWRGEREWPATGFPREDVFEYDGALYAVLQARWQTDSSVWDRAVPYTGESKDEQEQAEEDEEEDRRTEQAD